MGKTLEQHHAENPDIVAAARMIAPIAWSGEGEGLSFMRENSLAMARKLREQFKIEQAVVEGMAYELGVMHGRTEAETAAAMEQAAREADTRYLVVALVRSIFRRRPKAPKPEPYCQHSLGWDDCPVCCH